MKLYIVIVNYYTSKQIRTLLTSLHDSMSSGAEELDCLVFLVDNSCDDTEFNNLDRVADSFREGFCVETVQEACNRGFGSGINAGFNHALDRGACENDVLWILNPDMKFESGTVSSLLNLATEHPRALFSPVVTFAEDERVWFAGGDIDYRECSVTHSELGVPLSSLRFDDQIAPTEYLCGASIFCTVGLWKWLGGFDERLFMYSEDIDLSIRAARMGIPRYVDSSIVVHHQVGGSSGSGSGLSATYYFYSARNRELVFAGRRSLVRYWLYNIRLVARPLYHERGVRRRVFNSAAVCRGIYRGTQARRASA